MSDLQKFSAEGETGAARVRLEWLILDPNGRCYWRANHQGYSDVLGAGLYSEAEADSIVALGRGDRKVHVSDQHVQAALDHAREGLARFAAADQLVRASQEPSGWQPIETCPRDGRDVFIFDDSMPRWPAVNVARYQGFPDGSAGFISKCTVWPRDASTVMLKPRLWHPMIQIPPVPSVPLLRSLERLTENDDDEGVAQPLDGRTRPQGDLREVPNTKGSQR